MKEKSMPQSKKSETRGRAGSGKAAAADGDFEERLRRLEEVSSALKDGELPLEDALKRFEEGVRLARGLEKELSRIERRIEILVNTPEAENEKPELELFPELNGEEQER
jgi:exodeoxyribonuclease VII small subunit